MGIDPYLDDAIDYAVDGDTPVDEEEDYYEDEE
jgi:hypothetical protein